MALNKGDLMARPREFELEDALRGAMDVFWTQGYRATNLPDLLKAMGLTRGSFYQAFGDKEAAYLKALDYYDSEVVSKVVGMLNSCEKESAIDCLMPMFQPNGKEEKGCFICNAMVELGSENERAAAKTKAMAARLRNGILGVLVRYGAGQNGRSVAETADLILHLYFGKQAMGKAGGAQDDWESR